MDRTFETIDSARTETHARVASHARREGTTYTLAVAGVDCRITARDAVTLQRTRKLIGQVGARTGLGPAASWRLLRDARRIGAAGTCSIGPWRCFVDDFDARVLARYVELLDRLGSAVAANTDHCENCGA